MYFSGGSGGGTIIGKGPSNPLVVQAQGAQPIYSGVPSSSQVAPIFGSHQLSHLGTEPSPFVLQNPSVNPVPFTEGVNPGNSQEQPQIRCDDGITSNVSSGRYLNALI